jgi:hypothetical protein
MNVRQLCSLKERRSDAAPQRERDPHLDELVQASVVSGRFQNTVIAYDLGKARLLFIGPTRLPALSLACNVPLIMRKFPAVVVGDSF